MSSPPPLIQVLDLEVTFTTYGNPVYAVNGMSFSVLEGEMFGLVGESGCGKSVTALAMVGMASRLGQVHAGKIILRGEDLLKKTETEMQRIRGRRIAMIFQDPSASLNPVFTAGDQIQRVICQHTSFNRGQAKQRALDMFAAVALPDPIRVFRAYPHQLSGGMQQRVMIAIALSCGAELLIADEPTTALDVTTQAQILDLLVDLQKKQHISVLLITHNLGVVAETCQRVGVAYAGQLVESGHTQAVIEQSKHPYTQGLLAALPSPQQRGHPLQAIPGSVPSGRQRISGCPFHPRCTYGMDICRAQNPPMLPIQSDHQVACHLYPQEKAL